jgi:plasmid stabilization system protein ParE
VSFRVLLSPRAMKDIDRLEAWLLDKNASAAVRVGQVILDAVASLADLPERGRKAGGQRAINAPFGASAYVIRYSVRGDTIVVTRIQHGRE